MADTEIQIAYENGYHDGYQLALSELNGKKFEKVTRCKICRYWQDNNGGYPHPDCPWGKDETPDPDDYCSFGEPKEGDGE